MKESLVKACMSCNKVLALADRVPIIFQGGHLFLPNLCLACKFDIPYIEKVTCQKCCAYKPCYNDCSHIVELKQSFSAIQYTDKVQEWIKAFKFDGDMSKGEAIRPLLSIAIQRYKAAIGSSTKKCDVIKGLFSYREIDICCNIVTSVPISQQRLIERGFNQAEYFAHYVAKEIGAPYFSLLLRTNDFEHNSHLTKIEREYSVKDKFFINRSIFPLLVKHPVIFHAIHMKQPINIIVVDDIFTTGYTLRACATELQRVFGEGIAIYGMALARS